MRILHVVPSYIPAYRYGGPIYSVHGLCRALAARKHDVHVYTTNVDGDSDSNVPLGSQVDIDSVKVSYFPSRYARRLYWSPPMKKALRESVANFDLLHLHSIFLWPTFAAARASEKAKVPYIISPRGMLVKDLIRRKNRLIKTAWLSLFERHNLEHAAAIHVTSQTESVDISKFGFKLPHIFTVPNGFDLPDDGSESPVSQQICDIIGKSFLLFLGRVNWKKGLDRLIQALPYIKDIPLIIAGNDEENYTPELKRLAKKHGVSDRVIFTGPVRGDDKAALIQRTSALVLPSYSENFGIVVLEAMAAGCPVVVTPEVGIADTVLEAGSGIVVKGNPDILGNSINNLLSNPELMRQMGENGKRVVEEQFTWKAVALRMECVYKDMLT
jgi:glycosyltransferase involved in cell wall biosynthesis